MSDKVKYERLQDAKASVSARQGIYVYAPIAQQDRVGIVKGSDSVSVDSDGSIEVSDGFRAKVIQVFDTIPTDLTNLDNAYFIVDDVLYKVENGVANVANMELSKVQATILADPTDSSFIGMEDSTITIDILGTKFIFGQNEGSTNLPFYYTKSQIDGNINDIINQIINGTIVAGKALKDSLGNVIKDSYVSAIYPTYNDTTDKLYIETYGVDDVLLANNEVVLPKATTTKNGLMSKEDKTYVDSLPSALSLKENKSEKNQINGYAGLDGNAKIPSILLPDSILGQLEYKGTFDPTNGYPATPEKGWFYIAIANALISGVDYKVGDWAVYNGSSWDKVDNTDAVASVNGKLGVVVINGTEIQVGNGDTWTVEQRIVDIYAQLNNRYTKAQTYSNTEIEQRITDLLGLANLQDTAIEFAPSDYELDYDGIVASTFPATLVSDYNWVFVRVLVDDQAEYTVFKPSVSTNGVGIDLPLIQKDVFARIKRVNGNFEFALYKKSDNTLSPTTASVRMWGVKLDGITADEVEYAGGTVKKALDGLLVPEYITAEHEALQTEITATDAFEINDETGDVIKITGNEPANLVINGDFSVGISPWAGYYNATLSIEDNALKVVKSAAANISTFRQLKQLNITTDALFYFSIDIKTPETFVYFRLNAYVNGSDNFIQSPNYNVTPTDFTKFSHIGSFPSNVTTTHFGISVYVNSDINTYYFLKNIKVYNVSQMKLKGIKNDEGILFANLTNEEIKAQLDIWVKNGFPTVVEKLVSKSDNLFNGEFKTLTSLESENLISNSDLLIDSDSDGIPDGFTYGDATDISLTNGIAKFTATATRAYLNYAYTFTANDLIYFYANFKSDSNLVGILAANNDGTWKFHSGSGNYEFISNIKTATSFNNIRLSDRRESGFTPIEVDYMGAINITDLVNRGILPSGLSNNEYKEMIDRAMFANVPLRETDYITVEPNKAYKLIKVSANEVTHKVIEYTTDNQVVKVTPVVYTTNKFTFTTHALTSKIKLVSDLLERPTNLVTNGDFSSGVLSPWSNYYNAALDVVDGRLRVTKNAATNISTFLQPQNIEINTTDVYYFAFNFESSSILRYFRLAAVQSSGSIQRYIASPNIDLPANTPAFLSHIGVFNGAVSANRLGFSFYTLGEVGTTYFVDNLVVYNITEMKLKGVKDDNGTLFSRLTNDEIKDQMDLWVQNGFPDHVIAALYPNGVDSAIALKYNDADDVFRPQQIDELPLNLTLRSGEYWQDGYIIKQNGNAEYHPLNTKFSAWNYGQLEAVYTSGVPADFDIQFAQNTAGQVKTTQEFLVEAREQLDYVTEGYDSLVEKLGDAIFSDKYDSYAGITSDTYEYYNLEGIKEGNTLAIEGAGQSIQNLLGKGGTINATTTVRGITVTYDPLTGVFTANGTATAGSAFNITLATGMDFGLPVGTPMQLMRYYDGGTVDLNGSYIGYVLVGTSASNRINENSEALYDPYINGSGNLKPNHATDKQYLVLQCWAPGITFNNFKFKIGIYEGLQLRPFVLPSGEPAKSNVTIYNRTANKLNIPTALNITDSGITLTYDPLAQEFLLSGTATATKDISLNATFNVLSGDRLSIKRLYQSGDITAAGGTLPRIKLVNSTNTTIVYNDIYKMTAPEGEIPTPDVSFNTGTAPADDTLTLKLGITSGQVFDNYRFRLMIHDKSTDIGYVAYRKELLGNMSVGANERAVLEFKAIPYGILEFVADSGSLNLLFADGITDLNKTYLEYNAGIISPNRKISELTARVELIDNPFRNKVIAVWGDSRESNNPTSDPSGVGDQKDTSWPALLAKKLNATVLNYGLSGGAWAENTVQQDAASAIVNRVLTEDVSASADVIIISSMNDFKLASVLGSPSPDNKDKTTFYGAMRVTYDRLATKYPGKKIVLVLPQKRYDETVNYGGGSYYHYLKAQVEVAKEYGIPIVDLYHNFPNAKPTFYATNMLNDTHFSAVGNEKVAELVARELIGNGNKGDMDVIPPIPTTDGTYTLKVTITGGIPVFSWVVE